MIYLIGSLRNPEVPKIANRLRSEGHEVFDDWYAAGERADDHWRDYERDRGHSYLQALGGYAARNVFNFDKTHLDRCETAVLVLPAGKSGHLELGYVVGSGRRGYILLDSPERWDVMYQFATGVFDNVDSLVAELDVSKNPHDHSKYFPDVAYICTACRIYIGKDYTDTYLGKCYWCFMRMDRS